MIRKIVLGVCFLSFSACAFTYKPPVITNSGVNIKHQLSDEKAREQVIAALIEMGYTPKDTASKSLLTTENRKGLTEFDADCGTTMGLPYVKDGRTDTWYNVRTQFNKEEVFVITEVNGEYLKGDPMNGKVLTCVSTGAIEKRISAKLTERLK